MSELVLSLFPGIGLMDRALEDEGYCVVRGPDLLWGGDIRQFHAPAGRFDGVIGGPPCQAFSRLAHMVRAVHGEQAIAGNLIPEFERVVREAQPGWFLMEEVPAAPLPSVDGYIVRDQIINNRWLGEAQNRVRRISFGTTDGRRLDLDSETVPLEFAEWEHAVLSTSRAVAVALDRNHKPKSTRVNSQASPRSIGDMLRLQGFPENMLDDCPLTANGKRKAIANGVPLPMGRAIARAVRRAVDSRAKDRRERREGERRNERTYYLATVGQPHNSWG